MQTTSSEQLGFVVSFATSGKKAVELHSFLAQRESDGSEVMQKIRDVLNDTAGTVADLLEKERALADAENGEKQMPVENGNGLGWHGVKL